MLNSALFKKSVLLYYMMNSSDKIIKIEAKLGRRTWALQLCLPKELTI